MKATGNYGHVEFFEGGSPMTEDAVEKLKQAKVIDKQMGKILRERRLAKISLSRNSTHED